MEYLSKTCPIYSREKDGWVSEFEHTEVLYDEYNDMYYDIHGNMEVQSVRERDGQWWAVAVYTAYSMYGGPEEGGWWYSAGELVEHAKAKFFDNYQDAYDYAQELWLFCFEENKDRGDEKLVVRGFTEQMPDTHFPKNRPYYS